MSGQRSIGIIGGGVTGLTAAYRLLQRGHRIVVFEAGEAPGGLVRTFEVGGETLECFYHHLFTTDAAAIRLFEELGVLNRLTWHPSRVGIFYEGRVHPFTTPLDLLRFSPLPLHERVRLGLASMRLRRETDGSQFENLSAADWVKQELGERALDVVWGPLLRGKFGVMWDQVVAAWLWNKIHTRFSSRSGGISQGEVLGYMRGSFGAWTSTLVERVQGLGGEIVTSAKVSRIATAGQRTVVELGGGSREFDAVIATVANEIIVRSVPELPESYVEKLRGTPYQDAVCLVMALNRPLTDYYWLNVNDRDVPFVAVVEHTNLVGIERYGDRHIIYVSTYVERGAPLTREDADELLGLYAPHLRRINPAFEEAWVQEKWLFHARDAQPVFTVGAGSRVPEHRAPVPGLYLANMAQIYPQDRGQNYAIEMGERVAALVADDLSAVSVPRYQV